ncbi:MAG: sigma-70 family RNA polymerase sigma factor [Verrucomicrobia bacterium]|nr:sigma-70 family RNA polymerase sigma factor [Verrucomicrobiota bacterium]
MSEITRILKAVEHGDTKAADELLQLVYKELHKLAAREMAKHKPGQTLQPTALVNEAWLNLFGGKNPKFEGSAHFFRTAAKAMRNILVDIARRKKRVKHGGGQQRVDIQEIEIAAATKDDQILAIHEVLDKLAAQDEQKAELVELCYFVGLTRKEAAEVMRISLANANRKWALAKAWIFLEIQKSQR